MNKNTTKEDKTVIMSDKYLRESGLQGGKVIADNLVLGCLLIGIPLFIIGFLSLIYMLFVVGFPEDWPIIFYLLGPQSLATIIGLLLIFSGYSFYRGKQVKK